MDFNQIFSNEENIYLGHGTSVDNDKVIQSIMENGLRCSHGSLYFTSVLLGIGGYQKNNKNCLEIGHITIQRLLRLFLYQDNIK